MTIPESLIPAERFKPLSSRSPRLAVTAVAHPRASARGRPNLGNPGTMKWNRSTTMREPANPAAKPTTLFCGLTGRPSLLFRPHRLPAKYAELSLPNTRQRKNRIESEASGRLLRRTSHERKKPGYRKAK
jgi:hypothetical protein